MSFSKTHMARNERPLSDEEIALAGILGERFAKAGVPKQKARDKSFKIAVSLGDPKPQEPKEPSDESVQSGEKEDR